MKYLLDVNVLIALSLGAHVHHGAAERWAAQVKRTGGTLYSCTVSELGFVRITAAQGFLPGVAHAQTALAKLKKSLAVSLVDDGVGLDRLPRYVRTHGQVTDGHLAELAAAHGAQLATFDLRIPGAAVISP